MATVSEFIRRKDRKEVINTPIIPLPLDNTLVGIEVEMDQDASTPASFPEDFGPEWSRITDNSLSSGYEFVLAAPLRGQALTQAIYKLYREPTSVGRTYTGSTHIHVDMLDSVDLEALRTLVLLTYAFESLLYASGDLSRQWCGYANRLTSAPSEMIEQIMSMENFANFRDNINSNSRYYGLNLQAIIKYGSAEFRYFPTAESPEELIRWVKLVLLFKKAALEIGTVDKLIDLLSTHEGYNDFIATYFSEFPAEVEATGGYEKVRSLMTKALIISRTTRTAPRRRYQSTVLTGKYKTVIEKARKKIKRPKIPEGFKLNIVVTSPGDVLRDATAAVQEYRDNNNGQDPSLTLLLYSNGEIYYAKVRRMSTYEWWPTDDMPGSDYALVEPFLAAAPIVADFINANVGIVHRNTIENLNSTVRFLQELDEPNDEEEI